MYPNSITPETAVLLAKVSKTKIAKDFYLAGGTALAIHLGHRESIDLDWFSAKSLNNSGIKKELASLGKFELVSEAEGTINGVLDNIRVSFFYYDCKLLYPFVPFDNINLADERDIAAMKINAISLRGSKKDFIDLYFLLEKYPLKKLIEFFEQKFSNIKYNKLHILKSLTFFDDAENEPMPKMLKLVDWEAAKKRIRENTNVLLKT